MPPFSPDLSETTLSRNSVNFLCRYSSDSRFWSYWRFHNRIAFYSYNFLFLSSMASCSFRSFSSSAILLIELACSSPVLSLTSLIMACCSSLYFCLFLSSSLASCNIFSFCDVNYTSVWRSSRSFWRSLTAYNGLWDCTMKARTLFSSSSEILLFEFY